MKKVLSFFIALTIVLTLFPAAAVYAGEKEVIELNVADGQIFIAPAYYEQNGTKYVRSAEDTAYVITGSVLRANNLVIVANESDTADPVTFDITLKELKITPDDWASIFRFGGGGQGTYENVTVNLSMEGNVYLQGDNHPGLGGNAVVNIVSVKNAYFYSTALNSECARAISTDIKIVDKTGHLCFIVDGNIGVPYTDAYTKKPLIIFSRLNSAGITAPSVSAIEGQKLSEIKLENPEGNTPGKFLWVNPDDSVGEAGEKAKTFAAVFVPEDVDTYYPVIVEISVLVSAKTPEPVAAPAQVKGVKLVKGKKSFTVKWKKVSGADGYIIQFSLKKNMKKAKTVKVKNGAVVKKSVKKLKAGKKYYVKVRAYKNDGNKIIKGKWSAKKSVKIK